jgi:hypothetical protein
MARKSRDDHRPELIHQMVLAGITLQEIGISFGITRERARQLYKKSIEAAATVSSIEQLSFAGLTHQEIAGRIQATERGIDRLLISSNRQDILDRIILNDQELLTKFSHEVNTWVESHQGITVQEVVAAFQTSAEQVLGALTHYSRMLMLQLGENEDEFFLLTGEESHHKSANITFSRESIIKSIQAASKIENPLTSSTYARLIDTKSIVGPSVPRILQIFGTWRRACEISEVDSVDPFRKTYEKNWTENDVLEWVIKFIRGTGRASYGEYEQWAQSNSGAPSGSTVRNYMGNDWISVRREALRRCRLLWT